MWPAVIKSPTRIGMLTTRAEQWWACYPLWIVCSVGFGGRIYWWLVRASWRRRWQMSREFHVTGAGPILWRYSEGFCKFGPWFPGSAGVSSIGIDYTRWQSNLANYGLIVSSINRFNGGKLTFNLFNGIVWFSGFITLKTIAYLNSNWS